MKKYVLSAVLVAFIALGSNFSGAATHVGNGSVDPMKFAMSVPKVGGKDVSAEVVIDPKTNTVTVTNKGAAMPSHAELKMKAKDGSVQSVALSPNTAAAPTSFSGKLAQPSNTYSGFELRFSADAKQWSQVEQKIGM